MSKPVEYTVMGDDGREYGPVSASQIRHWVTEGRLEKKTPVKPTNTNDWIFLGQVRELKNLFDEQPVRLPKPRQPPRRGLVKAFFVVAVIAAIYYAYRYYQNPH